MRFFSALLFLCLACNTFSVTLYRPLFHHALQSESLKDIKGYAKDYTITDFNEKIDNKTYLEYALGNKKYAHEIIPWLVSRGATLNVDLIPAAYKENNPNAVEELIKLGVNFKYYRTDKDDTLHIISPQWIRKPNDEDIIFNPEAIEKNGDYAQGLLVWAAANNYVSLVKTLLNNGAPLKLYDKESKCTLLHSRSCKNIDIIKLLLESPHCCLNFLQHKDFKNMTACELSEHISKFPKKLTDDSYMQALFNHCTKVRSHRTKKGHRILTFAGQKFFKEKANLIKSYIYLLENRHRMLSNKSCRTFSDIVVLHT